MCMDGLSCACLSCLFWEILKRTGWPKGCPSHPPKPRRAETRLTQVGRSERRDEAYSFWYVESLSDARTKLTAFSPPCYGLTLMRSLIESKVSFGTTFFATNSPLTL